MNLAVYEIAKKAQQEAGTWCYEDVLTYVIRAKHDISPAGRIFRAIDALRAGELYVESDISAENTTRYNKRKEQGLCGRCGVEKERDKYVLCLGCREAMRECWRNKDEKKRQRKKRSAV